MSRYKSTFREPPWVIGSPKEVFDWMNATHPTKKEDEQEKKMEKYLKNLHIAFDFSVPQKKVEPTHYTTKILGKQFIEEDFDVLTAADVVLRGLAKAKFRNTEKIIIDGKTVYDHPEKKQDLRKTITIVEEYSHLFQNAKRIKIKAIIKDPIQSIAIIQIKKIHTSKEHSIDIQIKGKIRKYIYHTFLNYLKDNIRIKE